MILDLNSENPQVLQVYGLIKIEEQSNEIHQENLGTGTETPPFFRKSVGSIWPAEVLRGGPEWPPKYEYEKYYYFNSINIFFISL